MEENNAISKKCDKLTKLKEELYKKYAAPADKEPEMCAICHEEKEDMVKCNTCVAMYDESCIDQWIRKNPTCPMCRQPWKIPDQELRRSVHGAIVSLRDEHSTSEEVLVDFDVIRYLPEQDIDLVMAQASVSRPDAIRRLVTTNGDVANAITPVTVERYTEEDMALMREHSIRFGHIHAVMRRLQIDNHTALFMLCETEGDVDEAIRRLQNRRSLREV
jgi:NACalpha-BTF3-like transcription factor